MASGRVPKVMNMVGSVTVYNDTPFAGSNRLHVHVVGRARLFR